MAFFTHVSAQNFQSEILSAQKISLLESLLGDLCSTESQECPKEDCPNTPLRSLAKKVHQVVDQQVRIA